MRHQHAISRTLSNRFVLPATLSLAWTWACGGPSTPAEPPPSAEAEETLSDAEATEVEADVAEGKVKFDEMKHGEQVDYMKKVVAPQMAKLFQSHDAEEFAKMGCPTCHGPGVKKGNFEMPNGDLPKLNPNDMFAEHVADEPEMTKFMMEQVVPEMAKLLGEEPFNPETGKGFGCFDCHVKK